MIKIRKGVKDLRYEWQIHKSGVFTDWAQSVSFSVNPIYWTVDFNVSITSAQMPVLLMIAFVLQGHTLLGPHTWNLLKAPKSLSLCNWAALRTQQIVQSAELCGFMSHVFDVGICCAYSLKWLNYCIYIKSSPRDSELLLSFWSYKFFVITHTAQI